MRTHPPTGLANDDVSTTIEACMHSIQLRTHILVSMIAQNLAPATYHIIGLKDVCIL